MSYFLHNRIIKNCKSTEKVLIHLYLDFPKIGRARHMVGITSPRDAPLLPLSL